MAFGTGMRSLAVAAGLALSALLVAAPAQAVSVSLNQDPAGSIEVGDTFTLTLSTSADFPAFNGYQAEISYDADAVQLLSITADTVFDFPPSDAVPVGASGPTVVGPLIAGNVFTPEPSGALDLVTLQFSALMAGNTVVEVREAGGFDGFFLNAASDTVFDGVAQTTVSVFQGSGTVIPLPAPAFLLLSGIGALVLVRRRHAV
ncbi:MAG: VPLPA-CTERM sorting domain-containing protein [Pseudomonadota bacterium]